MDPNDAILVLLNNIINACLTHTAERRPSVASINSKFAVFIRDLIGAAL